LGYKIAPAVEDSTIRLLYSRFVVPALSGLAGTFLGGWIATRNQGKERRHRRYEEQLRFYAELLSIRKVILAKHELRLRLHHMTHESFKEEIGLASEQGPTPLRDHLYTRRGEEYDKLTDYDDNQYRQEVIPLYRKMLEHWTAHMAQAEPSTQQHFATLVDFVEIMDRFLKKSLPLAVLRQLTHEESKLHSLYDDIETQVERLRKKLLT
jgi:hypothetical protein